MNKATARAHSNIAFIKYWGRIDEGLRLPTNGSISMNLSNLFTTTTVEFAEGFHEDDCLVDNAADTQASARISQHLDRVRKMAGSSLKARVVSNNNFPTGTGLSSSASGFAALTVASVAAMGLHLSERELSILARLGSGSASRSIPEGFVEWVKGNTNESSFSQTIYSKDHWDIVDFVVIVSEEKKDIATSEGQKRVESSIFFQNRLDHIQGKIVKCKEYISQREFSSFGKLMEMEALELHAIMITSWPSLIYWLPQSLYVMRSVKKWREEGLEVYFTVNTGQDVHIICQAKDKDVIASKIDTLKGILKVIPNTASVGTSIIQEHLF